MAYLQGRIEPQARHEYRQEGQAAPPLRAVLVIRTVTGVLGELALRVRGAVVADALRATQARDGIYGGPDHVGCVLARPPRVLVLGVQFVTVSTPHLGLGLVLDFEGERGLLRGVHLHAQAAFLQARRGVPTEQRGLLLVFGWVDVLMDSG